MEDVLYQAKGRQTLININSTWNIKRNTEKLEHLDQFTYSLDVYFVLLLFMSYTHLIIFLSHFFSPSSLFVRCVVSAAHVYLTEHNYKYEYKFR